MKQASDVGWGGVGAGPQESVQVLVSPSEWEEEVEGRVLQGRCFEAGLEARLCRAVKMALFLSAGTILGVGVHSEPGGKRPQPSWEGTDDQ